MTEREALLAAVCANPEDDTPRLVFADWLQENGAPERAEFIRLQCRRASEQAFDSLDNWNCRLRRELALWQEFGDRWLAELTSSDTLRLDWGGDFDRGFAGEMLTVHARLDIVPEYVWIRWEGADCSNLDWELLYRSSPIARLKFCNLSNWRYCLSLAESTRPKSICLVECEIDESSLQTLLEWGRSSTGHLLLRRDHPDPEWEGRLASAFAERYKRKPVYDC